MRMLANVELPKDHEFEELFKTYMDAKKALESYLYHEKLDIVIEKETVSGN